MCFSTTTASKLPQTVLLTFLNFSTTTASLFYTFLGDGPGSVHSDSFDANGSHASEDEMTDSFNQRVGINDAGDGASVYKNSALDDLLDVMETTLDGYKMDDINNITEVFNDNTFNNTFNREKKRQLQVQQQNQAREQYLTQQKNSNHNNVAYLNGSSGGTGGTGDNIHGYGDNQTELLLPPGWFVEKDDKSGKYYYANIRTGKFTNQQTKKFLHVFNLNFLKKF